MLADCTRGGKPILADARLFRRLVHVSTTLAILMASVSTRCSATGTIILIIRDHHPLVRRLGRTVSSAGVVLRQFHVLDAD